MYVIYIYIYKFSFFEISCIIVYFSMFLPNSIRCRLIHVVTSLFLRRSWGWLSGLKGHAKNNDPATYPTPNDHNPRQLEDIVSHTMLDIIQFSHDIPMIFPSEHPLSLIYPLKMVDNPSSCAADNLILMTRGTSRNQATASAFSRCCALRREHSMTIHDDPSEYTIRIHKNHIESCNMIDPKNRWFKDKAQKAEVINVDATFIVYS